MTTIAQAPGALEVRDLVVRFGGVTAVDHVSFAIEPGRIVGLIGPNGAGKTTIFDAVSGFVPSSGMVLLGDRRVEGLSAAERAREGLGRSFQDGRLFPSLTVRETLAVALERHSDRIGPVNAMIGVGPSRRAERAVTARVAELIDLLGLAAFRDKFIAELSTGSRRIVDLACSIAHEPRVLLLDEPSSGIAQRETEALGPLLLRIRETIGCTMLLIEHDMPLIAAVSDELIALETGRVLVRGPCASVLRDPLVVEAYLGTDESAIFRSGEAASLACAAITKAGRRCARRAASGSVTCAAHRPVESTLA